MSIIRKVKENVLIRCNNEEECKELWNWFHENGYCVQPRTEDSLETMLEAFSLGRNCFFITKNNWHSCSEKNSFSDEIVIDFSSLTESALTAEEILYWRDKICDHYQSVCPECPLFDACEHESTACRGEKTKRIIYADIVRVCSIWKKQDECTPKVGDEVLFKRKNQISQTGVVLEIKKTPSYKDTDLFVVYTKKKTVEEWSLKDIEKTGNKTSVDKIFDM